MGAGCGDEGPERCFFSGKIGYLSISQNPAFLAKLGNSFIMFDPKKYIWKKQQCPHDAIVESAKDM